MIVMVTICIHLTKLIKSMHFIVCKLLDLKPIFLSINLFIFGCIGSSLLRAGFL